jgi:hypothetical protein
MSTCELLSPILSIYLCSPPFSGPVISPAAKDRILGLIGSAEQEGGKIHLDGRHVKVSGYEHGNFIGPTIIEANTSMKCYEWVAFCVHRSQYKDLPQSRNIWTCPRCYQGGHAR